MTNAISVDKLEKDAPRKGFWNSWVEIIIDLCVRSLQVEIQSVMLQWNSQYCMWSLEGPHVQYSRRTRTHVILATIQSRLCTLQHTVLSICIVALWSSTWKTPYIPLLSLKSPHSGDIGCFGQWRACTASVLGLELDLGGERNNTEAGATFIHGAHFTSRLVFIGILHAINTTKWSKAGLLLLWLSLMVTIHLLSEFVRVQQDPTFALESSECVRLVFYGPATFIRSKTKIKVSDNYSRKSVLQKYLTSCWR